MNRATYEKLFTAGIAVIPMPKIKNKIKVEARNVFRASRLAQQRKPDAEKIADARKRRAQMRAARIRGKVKA